jgi:UDP-hydrolysing UDP-N-acetyl-D-glucosamine 2-epimerase
MKKKICAILTNRTNYSKLKLVLFELRKIPNVELDIVASSSSLLEKYGSSFKDLEADGFTVNHRIDCLMMNDTHSAAVQTAGLSMLYHGDYFKHSRPDLLLLVGDRFDALSPAIAASMMNIPIAHIQGGETSGTIDNKVRDLISKVSTSHFVATEKSAARLEKWGIPNESIFDYGCPAVEYVSDIDVGRHLDSALIHKQFKREIKIKPNEEYFLVIAHPDTTNAQDIDMKIVLEAVESFGKKAFVFYPNIDPNNSAMVSGIARFNKNDNFYMIRHMPLEGFVHTMAHACCMIGNSSAGIREAASFGVPVVNIGERQQGRERNRNTVDVSCKYEDLVAVIKNEMNKKYPKENIYYKKNCSKRIAEELYSELMRSENV